MVIKEATSKQQKEIDEIKSGCKKVLDMVEFGDFIEITVNRWGDIETYRVYSDGSVYER